MSCPKHINLIRKDINKAEKGAFFFPSDFYYITDPVQVNICLKRICDHGGLVRVSRGIFTKNDKYLPKKEEIAQAIARKHGWTVVPCGESALYAANLSFCSPEICTYVSDGIYQEYTCYDKTFKFKSTSKIDEIKGVSYETALCIQALRAIGKDKVSDKQIQILAKTIKLVDKRPVYYGKLKITAWIKNNLRKIFDEASKNAIISDENYTKKYEDNQIVTTPFGYEVRSKSEALIATNLHIAGLDFKYESSLLSKDGVPIRPDFKITHKGKVYYWEHLGMLDNKPYVLKWQEKERIYNTSFNDQLITTDEYSDVGVQIINLLRNKFSIDIAPDTQ